MTPDQINAAIAETQGWNHYGCTGCAMSLCVCNEWIHAESEWPTSNLPNYHGALDAIVPVIRAMPEEEQHQVIIELCRITLRSRFATPAQWCEAYLKAKGLWK
jgi:hypothetical protein